MTDEPRTGKGSPNAARAGTFELGGNLAVRRLGYGAMRLPGPGVWGEPEDPEGAKAVLRRAVELGVNLIDTAGFYGPVVADRLIAATLYPYPENLVIATKVGVTRGPDKSWRPHARPEDLRADVEDNLKRLRLERLDLVYLRLGDGVALEDSGVRRCVGRCIPRNVPWKPFGSPGHSHCEFTIMRGLRLRVLVGGNVANDRSYV
jgi:pyridoxine 4-dehydrogenase